MTNWCILRTAPSRTLLLAAALIDAGYQAWSPQEVFSRRKPRSNDFVRVTRSLTPMLVFAEYERLPELVFLSRQPMPSYTRWDDELQCDVTRSVPVFSVFRYMDHYPRVADKQLDPLRIAEQRERPRQLARVFAPGETVKYAYAGFDGLIGTVRGTKGRYASVLFPGFNVPVKIASNILLPAGAATAYVGA